MEKNTLLAIALSMAVLIGFYFLFPQPQRPPSTSQGETQQYVPPVPGQQSPVLGQQPAATGGFAASEVDAPAYEERVTVETDLLTVVLSNAGGSIVSYKLKEQKDGDDLVEMVLSGSNEARAFTVALGDRDTQAELFHAEQVGNVVTFSRDFLIQLGSETARFTLIKKYEFKPGDYMFELKVSLVGDHSMTSGFNFSAYTLSFGPQIGPLFEKLDGRYDYREYITFNNGKRKKEKPGDVIIYSNPKWAAIAGKYFTCIAVPYVPQYGISFSERPEPGLPSASRLSISRPIQNSPSIDDTYRFYLGPKNQDVLKAYNTGDNPFGITDMQLTEVASTRGILSPLEKALKWLLVLFFRLIPNYGIAIILVTLVVKIIFFPLTKKGSEATLRMQALAPKIKELQEKYKDNRQKLNMEMAEFYKKEGYNPLSGCLPMLLQIPIFFAMYNLFNNHFDLRGAVFIPGWIPDLSMPEAVWNFPDGVRLPLLGWTALRLLPFVYVGSQLLYGKVTQTPDQQGNSQQKIMLYIMPIVFFFILYNVPSGLLIYWIFSNLFTMVQQVGLNKYNAKKRSAAATADAAKNASPIFAPHKKKKR